MGLIAGCPIVILLSIAALTGGLPPAAAKQGAGPKSVEQVLADYVRACGGQALEGIKAETWKGRLRRGARRGDRGCRAIRTTLVLPERATPRVLQGQARRLQRTIGTPSPAPILLLDRATEEQDLPGT